MRTMTAIPVMTAALLGLAACVGNETPASTAPAAPRTATPAASAAISINGTFTGTLGAPTATGSGTGSQCYQSGTPQTLRVANGQLRGGIFYRQFNGPVGADGSFNLTGPDSRNNGNPGTIEGRVTPTGLEGTFTFRVGTRTTCTYALSGLTRS